MVKQWSRKRGIPGSKPVDALVPFDKASILINKYLGEDLKGHVPASVVIAALVIAILVPKVDF